MYKRTVLILDEKTEKDLFFLFDVAMKLSGVQVATAIANVVNAIEQEKDDDLPPFLGEESEEW